MVNHLGVSSILALLPKGNSGGQLQLDPLHITANNTMWVWMQKTFNNLKLGLLEYNRHKAVVESNKFHQGMDPDVSQTRRATGHTTNPVYVTYLQYDLPITPPH